MSESIRRKSSSRQLLQNLIRVTAQRSQEDAEELERERRRRAREKERGEESPTWTEPPQEEHLSHDTETDEELKPSCCFVLEEDEGFSDWSHRLETRNEDDCGLRVQGASMQRWKPEPDEGEKRRGGEGEEPERSTPSQEASTRPPEKSSSNRKEVRTSYSSTVFLPQDARLPDRTSYLMAGTMRRRKGTCRADGQEDEPKVAPQREGRSAETPQSARDEDYQEGEEEEELKFTCEVQEDVHLRREEEEKHKMPEKGSVDGRRSEEVGQRSVGSLCSSSSEGEEPLNCYGPMSPTFKKLLVQFYPDEVSSKVSTDGKCTVRSKIIERTESLRKSTGSIKKTLPPVPVSKIDKKLEQYTQALEISSKEGRLSSQALTDLTSPAEPVASKKSLFEAGEVWNQNATSVTASKDADSLKVGVADLINQWVKGSEDASRCSSPSRPAESSTGKRYKFVVTGHGKYEKVSVNDACSEDINSPAVGPFYEDL